VVRLPVCTIVAKATKDQLAECGTSWTSNTIRIPKDSIVDWFRAVAAVARLARSCGGMRRCARKRKAKETPIVDNHHGIVVFFATLIIGAARPFATRTEG